MSTDDARRDAAASRVDSHPVLSRRNALVRLGLTSAVAYMAPTLVRVDRSANATVLPTPCSPPGGSWGYSRGGRDDDEGGGGGCSGGGGHDDDDGHGGGWGHD